MVTKKRIRLLPSIPKTSRGSHADEPETFVVLRKLSSTKIEDTNEDEVEDSIDLRDEPFMTCAEDGLETGTDTGGANSVDITRMGIISDRGSYEKQVHKLYDSRSGWTI
ncbi:hypothetical protein JCM33374_g4607 [Metschnikowia sp. JCM 33374]|nr:hypothetical protein JCM33374_g4607 [Metschnikowia sp. JCM 33374]